MHSGLISPNAPYTFTPFEIRNVPFWRQGRWYSVIPVQFIVGDNRLSRAPRTHPIFDGIQALCICVQKANFFLACEKDRKIVRCFYFRLKIRNWPWFSCYDLLIIRKTQLCIGSFFLMLLVFFCLLFYL